MKKTNLTTTEVAAVAAAAAEETSTMSIRNGNKITFDFTTPADVMSVIEFLLQHDCLGDPSDHIYTRVLIDRWKTSLMPDASCDQIERRFQTDS